MYMVFYYFLNGEKTELSTHSHCCYMDCVRDTKVDMALDIHQVDQLKNMSYRGDYSGGISALK